MNFNNIKFANTTLRKDFESFLFNNVKLKKNYRFFVFYFYKKEDLKISTEVINSIIEYCAFFTYDNKMIIFTYYDLDINLSELKNVIEYDLGIGFDSFESGILSAKNNVNFFRYYNLYDNNLIKNQKELTFKNLILDIAFSNKKLLYENKDLFLNKINDENYKELINSLLNNNINVSKTANEVYMHRNTINNKIEIIKKETALNIQNFHDAFCIYLLINA